MSNLDKKHYYLVHATFTDSNNHNLSHDYDGTLCLKDTKVTKSVLDDIRNSITAHIQNQKPEIGISDFILTSVSYLGEMTEAEFNS